MTSLQTIVEHLDSILDPAAYDDYGPNGLQVPGRETVETVVTGVSANVELFARARDADADLVLVHHGLFWAGPPRPRPFRGRPAATARPRRQAPAAGPLRRRHEPRRVPPAARRPPRARQQ